MTNDGKGALANKVQLYIYYDDKTDRRFLLPSKTVPGPHHNLSETFTVTYSIVDWWIS